MPNPFRWAYVGLSLAALTLVGAALVWPRAEAPRQPQAPPSTARQADAPRADRHAVIPSTLWGQTIYRQEGMSVMLGPAADRRRRYELALGRHDHTPTTLLVSNDGGRTFFPLPGSPMGHCGYHWQGYGVNAILAQHECVPWWAVDRSGAHAERWVRVENLVPFARVVMLRYYLPGSDLSRSKAP
jgi:hypothetical protein